MSPLYRSRSFATIEPQIIQLDTILLILYTLRHIGWTFKRTSYYKFAKTGFLLQSTGSKTATAKSRSNMLCMDLWLLQSNIKTLRQLCPVTEKWLQKEAVVSAEHCQSSHRIGQLWKRKLHSSNTYLAGWTFIEEIGYVICLLPFFFCVSIIFLAATVWQSWTLVFARSYISCCANIILSCNCDVIVIEM